MLSVANLFHKTGSRLQCEELCQHVRVAASDPATRAQARFLIKSIRKAERRATKEGRGPKPPAAGQARNSAQSAARARDSFSVAPRMVFGNPLSPAMFGARRKNAPAPASTSAPAVFQSEDVREKRKAQGN